MFRYRALFVSILFAAPPAAAEREYLSLHGMLGGQGIGIGSYIEVPLTGSSRVMLGQGDTVDFLGFLDDGDSDERETVYLNYVHAVPGTGTRFEWAIGPARIERAYNRLFSDSRDFKVETWALTGSLGLRHDATNGWFTWRVGVAPIILLDQPQPRVYNEDAIYRAYMSIGVRF